MNRVAGVMKMHFQDKKSMFLIPWLVTIGSFLLNYVISFLVGGKTDMYTGGLATIYIYMFVASIVTLVQIFPFALGFSIRRTDFYLGTVAAALIISAVTAILLVLLSFAESDWTGGWGIRLHFFHLPYISEGTALQQLWINFSLMVYMFFSGYIISALYRRFGRNGLFVFFPAAFLAMTVFSYIMTNYGLWGALLDWFVRQTAAGVALWLIALSALYALATYALLLKSTA